MKIHESEKQRILYVGHLGPHSNGFHRQLGMKRLGHEVFGLNTIPYSIAGGPIFSRMRYRSVMGPTVDRLNRDVLEAVRSFQPTLIWFDKAKYVRRDTVSKARAQGVFTVHQNDDNPFQTHSERGSRHIMAALPEYDLHLVTRRISLAQYRAAGARDVRWFPPMYEPSLHYPPPAGWTDADRTIDVSFIGHPYDKRPGFLLELWQRHGIKTLIWGDPQWSRRWPRAKLPAKARAELFQGSFLPTAQFRETIWRSKIVLGFVNNLNLEEFAGRSFEVPGCGGFMLMEDTQGHRDMYKDGEEIVLFKTVEDCVEKIRRYLPDEEARTRIARAGHARAVAGGYSTDARIGEVIQYIKSKA